MIRLRGWMGKRRRVVALAAAGAVCFGLGVTVSSWGGPARVR